MDEGFDGEKDGNKMSQMVGTAHLAQNDKYPML